MFAAAAVLLSVSSWWMLPRSLAATEYHELQERAKDVQLLLTQLGPSASLELLQQKFDEIYRVKDDGKYLQVLDQDGHWIYRSKRLIYEDLRPVAPGDLPVKGTVVELHQGTRYVRVLSYAIKANGRAYSVQTGIALNKSMVLLSAFGAQLLLLTPAVLVLAAIGGHFMSRKALAPVAAIATEARRINDWSLDIRLPIAATKDEISHLSETLNQMLERVESGVRSIRDFTANAAHELRTPLVLIRTEVEVALSKPRITEEYREACEQVQLETVRMTASLTAYSCSPARMQGLRRSASNCWTRMSSFSRLESNGRRQRDWPFSISTWSLGRRQCFSLAISIACRGCLRYCSTMPCATRHPVVQWLCVLEGEMDLHTASADLTRRSSYLATVQASNALAHILETMQQAATGAAAPARLESLEIAR
jgi:HAMP domain-containing protein